MKTKRYYVMNSGVKIYPHDIEERDINLHDIAHHLTNIQRFGGALPFNVKYSVAEHSLNLTEYVLARYGDVELAKACLLHDASEAYLGDVVSPLKDLLLDYKDLEWNLMQTIQKKYSIDFRYDSMVSYFDHAILLDEVKALIPNKLELFNDGNSLGLEIKSGRTSNQIKRQFLDLCNELNILEN